MQKPKIKYCGNHSLHDLQVASESRCDFIGFVFSRSKREVSHKSVRQWLEHVKLGRGQQLVGLFVRPEIQTIEHVLTDVPLSVIQLHGDESPEFTAGVRETFGLPVWKAIHHGPDGLEKMRAYAGSCDGFVIDSKVKNRWGGTGRRFDWRHVCRYTAEAERLGVFCLIAGGIRPENITELLRYHVHGVDISSGIEENGKKSAQKMKQIEEAIQ